MKKNKDIEQKENFEKTTNAKNSLKMPKMTKLTGDPSWMYEALGWDKDDKSKTTKRNR